MTMTIGYSNDYGVHWQDNSSILCFIAGILLAILVASRSILFGKVTGISGILSETITVVKDYKWNSMMFVGGIFCGGAIAREFLPACFEDWSTLPVERLVIAGVLVGFGTKTANGCTSGIIIIIIVVVIIIMIIIIMVIIIIIIVIAIIIIIIIITIIFKVMAYVECHHFDFDHLLQHVRLC